MRLTDSILVGLVTGFIGIVSLVMPPTVHAQRGGSVNCASSDGRNTRCSVPWRDAQIVRQDSRAACIRGRTWDIDRRGLWVSQGCRAVFVEAGRGHHGSHGGGHSNSGWNRDIRLGCVSSDNRYQLCRVDVGSRGNVRLVRQESRSRCTEGYSWGWNRAGVWVNHGCRADFVVSRR